MELAFATTWQYGGGLTEGANTAEGSTFSGPVISGLGCSSANGASATIDWGDGSGIDSTTPRVTYDPPSGTCAISGSHRYAEENNYSMTIQYTDSNGKRQMIPDSAGVFDRTFPAPVVAPIKARVGEPLRATVAMFSDPGGDPATYVATIDWGDHETSAGTVIGENVIGSHSYSAPGSYQLMVKLADDGGAVNTGLGTATVSPGPTSSPITGPLLRYASMSKNGILTVGLNREATLYGVVYRLPRQRRVAVLHLGHHPAGVVRLRWHHLVNGRPLPPGRYLLQPIAGIGAETIAGPKLAFTIR